jgi:hypothetical protein
MTEARREGEESESSEEFYIGYAIARPPQVTRFVSKVVMVTALCVVATALLVATAHRPLDGGVFEFGHPQSFTGIIAEHPYPALRVDGASDSEPWLLLVATGKHGAASLVTGLDGRHVSLQGTRILRNGRTVVELAQAPVAADSPTPQSRARGPAPGEVSVRLTGEVVDSKCFMGVMVPGDGKTHRDCASLCLRGGIPPALLVRDHTGGSALLLLVGAEGEELGPRLSEFAGDTVDVTGAIDDEGGWPVMRVRSFERK